MTFIQPAISGPSANRPTWTADDIGFEYFDTDLGVPLVWNGAAWKLADGSDPATLQGITVEFDQVAFDVEASSPGNGAIAVKVTTSDLAVTSRDIHVDVKTLLTGTAVDGVNFNAGPPQTVVIPAGTASGGTVSTATIDYIEDSPNLPKTVDLELENVVGGASIGPDSASTATLVYSFAISTASPLPRGTLGETYLQTITSVNGDAPVVLTLHAGALPDGCVFVDNGDGTGKVTTAIPDGGTGQLDAGGDFNFTIRAVDDSGYIVDKPFAVTIQSVTVEFTAATGDISTAAPGPDASQIVKITTSDGGTLVSQVTVDVVDDGTGTAADPADYTVESPQTLTFPAGSADQSTQPVQTTYVSPNPAPPKTIDRSLANPTKATLGVQTTHITSLIA